MTLCSLPYRIARETVASAVFGLVLFALSASANAQKTIDEILSAIVRVQTEINSSGSTAPVLGIERDGHGAVINSSGLVLTIGYLTLESQKVTVTVSNGTTYPARFVAYDSETGFGLIRTQTALKSKPMRLGDSSRLAEGTGVIVAGLAGAATRSARSSSRAENSQGTGSICCPRRSSGSRRFAYSAVPR